MRSYDGHSVQNRAFTTWSALRASFWHYFSNIITLNLILVLTLIPSFAIYVVLGREEIASNNMYDWKWLLYDILYAVYFMYIYTCLELGFLAKFQGRQFSVQAITQHALVRFPIYLGASLICMLSMILGLALFIFPGILLGARWFLVDCVALNERLGIRQTLSRTVFLTQNYRWSFSLLVVFTFMWHIPSIYYRVIYPDTNISTIAYWLLSLWDIQISAIGAILSAMLYTKLSKEKRDQAYKTTH